MFRLLAMTGARRGEVPGLRWVDIDLDGARATIRKALLNGDGEVYVSSPTSYRGLTVDLATVDKLREHRDRQLLKAATDTSVGRTRVCVHQRKRITIKSGDVDEGVSADR